MLLGRRRARAPSRRAARGARAALAAALLSACAGARPPPPREAAPPAPGTEVSQVAGRYGGPEEPLSLTPIEASALELVRARLARAGRPPEPSPALARAARELAGVAAAGGDATSFAALRNALAGASAADAAPSIRIQRGPSDAVAGMLADSIPPGRATHVGVGAAPGPDGAPVLVLLSSERGARLDPFPRGVRPGATARLSGTLRQGLTHPRVIVTRPDGRTEPISTRGDPAFSARIAFPAPGRHGVEVVADGVGGPTVAALFVVSVGGAPLDAPTRPRLEDPPDLAEAEAAVVRAIDATRRAHGLAPLAPSAAVGAVARRHSEAMLAAGEVAHRLPSSIDLGARLRRAGIPYRRVFENAARARSALEAHDLSESSPAHLANVLSKDATSVGVGAARGQLPTGDPIVYLTEIFVEGPDDGTTSRLTPSERVRQVIWAERARRGAPPLTADGHLDALAQEAARAMLAADRPEEGDLAARALAAGRTLAAVDVYVADALAEATRSRNLGDARFRRVGIGVATGGSARFGPGRTWIAVVYTD